MSIQQESPQSTNREFGNGQGDEASPPLSNEELNEESHEESNEAKDNAALGIRDKLFLYASGTEILLGLILVYLPIIPLIPIIPSVLLGSGIATFVYRFMGGLKQNDSLVMGGVKLTGTLASLLIAATVVNTLLKQQVEETQLSFEPAGGDVLVLKKSNGELVNLEVEIKNRRVKYKINKDSGLLADNFNRLNPIKSSCLDGKGICRDEWKPVLFAIADGLKRNQATVCEEYARELDQIPIQIAPPQKKEGEVVNAALVSITDDVKVPCATKPLYGNKPMVIFISPDTAKNLGKTQLKPGQTAEGTAKIAPLRGILFDYKSVNRVINSSLAQRLTTSPRVD
jgi:hypothetical protein